MAAKRASTDAFVPSHHELTFSLAPFAMSFNACASESTSAFS